MTAIPEPIFTKDLSNITWKRIMDREYGVQYCEVAVSLLAFATHHFPQKSASQIVIPGDDKNITFYIDSSSWTKLVEGLNNKYTSDVKKLEAYEKQFITSGNAYLKIAKDIAALNLNKLSNEALLKLFLKHQEKKNHYLAFGWSSFILNNFVADHATEILDTYIGKTHDRHEIITSLFKPKKLAAVLSLQNAVEKAAGQFSIEQFDALYEKYKWLPCLDIQNKPWTKTEFKKQITSFTKQPKQKTHSFEQIIKLLSPTANDEAYLRMAQRFVYIKDARDDFRRESMFYTASLWQELGKRMGIPTEDVTYLLDAEIIRFLKEDATISKKTIALRKQGFIVYIDKQNNLVCLQGDIINEALKRFKLLPETEKTQAIIGRTAAKGKASGKVTIVRGVNDLGKVKKGTIFVAVTTHPDYVAAMRKAAAIITDEGGITSHAAIVSREYGIPCIVGTKSATTVLKDGDGVDVDADKGIVTIIH